jgi:hypothetical protein
MKYIELMKYDGCVYGTFEDLAKAIRKNHRGASDNLSDEYIIKESYTLAEWKYIPLGDVLKLHNELVSESREMLNTMNQCIFNMWRDDLECTITCIVIEDVEDGVKLDDNEPIEGGKVTEHIKTINELTNYPLEHINGTYL